MDRAMEMTGESRPEDKTIKEFVRYLATKLYACLQLADWPDKKPGSSGEIDAVAKGADKEIAIEHTSIDYLPNKRLDDIRFTKVFVPLEEELRDRTHLRVCISIQHGAVLPGMHWEAIRTSLRAWIEHQVPLLPNGVTSHRISGIPFPITVRKPTIAPRLWFARQAEDDPNFVDRLRALVDEKVRKLKKYSERGYLTVLLIENGDLANMNLSCMIEAAGEAHPNNLPSGLNRLWYADTSIAGLYQFWNVTPASRAKMHLMNATEELNNPPE